MGNLPSSALTAPRPSTTLDSYVEELGRDVIYVKSIGTSRFLKTIQAQHQNGPLLIKIFLKSDPAMSLLVHRRRLKADRETLIDVPNILPYQTVVETEKAGYLVRQFLASDLYDRISTRPFLTSIEKKWFTYQILHAMVELHSHNLSHGDLKPSNVLVSSSNYLYLTDLSPFKPVFLPSDDPSMFSFFFDGPSSSSSRRSCYLAPERFYSPGSKADRKRRERESEGGGSWEEGVRDGKVTEAMDVFSAGCVIAELWLEGKDVFSLSGMLGWKKGESSPEGVIGEIDDEGIRNMVASMITLDPVDRPSFSTILSDYQSITLPDFFYSFFHHFNATLHAPLPSDGSRLSPFARGGLARLGGGPSEPSSIAGSFVGGTGIDGTREDEELPSEGDWRIERLRRDWEGVRVWLDGEMEGNGDGQASDLEDKTPLLEDGPALLLHTLITSNIRNCYRPTSKVSALQLISDLLPHLTDEAKLDRTVPFVVSMLTDPSPEVRGEAIRGLTNTLDHVQTVTPSNTSVMTEYVLPHASHLACDEDVSVRCAWVSALSGLAETGRRFLELGESLKAVGGLGGIEGEGEIAHDQSHLELHRLIQSSLASLLSDPSSIVKRALLPSISTFCAFFGRAKTDELVLSHLFTYLNDSDWSLRCAFFESIVGVGAFVGMEKVEGFVLPLMLQALGDPEESVVSRVIISLKSLVELDLFNKLRVWQVLRIVLPFLVHPNRWIRQATAGLVASIARRLPKVDVWCILHPELRPFLESDIPTLTEQAILDALQPPLSRSSFEGALVWASNPGGDSKFWVLNDARSSAKKKSQTDGLEKSSDSSMVRDQLSLEDETHLAHLRQRGLGPADYTKLVALKPHLVRLVRSRTQSAFFTRSDSSTTFETPPSTQEITLLQLKITPETVFVSPRSLGGSNKQPSSSRRLSKRSSTRSNLQSRAFSSLNPLQHQLQRRTSTTAESLASVSLGAPSRPTSPIPLSTVPTFNPSSNLQPPHPSISPSISTTSLQSLSVTGGEGRSRSHLSRLPPKSSPSISAANTTVEGVFEKSLAMRLADDDERGSVSGRLTPGSSTLHREGSSPHLVSSSVFTGYDGTDPNLKAILENVYLETFRDPLPNFGPRILPSSVRRKQAARSPIVPSRPPNHLSQSHNSHLDATLISQLSEPSSSTITPSPIRFLAVSPDNVFFLTLSDAGTLKIWDTARLERSASAKARLVHEGKKRPTSFCLIEASHSFVIGWEDGTVEVWRVHLQMGGSAPKYRELELVTLFRLEEGEQEFVVALGHVVSESANELILLTTQSRIHTLDLRSLRIKRTLSLPLHLGPPSALVLDANHLWLTVGTGSGWLALFDLRFGMLLRSWRMSGGGGVRKVVRHPSMGGGKWVMVACAGGVDDRVMLETWDVDTGLLVEVFRSERGRTLPPSVERRSSSLVPASEPIASGSTLAEPSMLITALLAPSTTPNSSISPIPNRDSNLTTLPPFPSTNAIAFLFPSDSTNEPPSSTSRSKLAADGGKRDGLRPLSEDADSSSGPTVFVGGTDRHLRSLDFGHLARCGIVGEGAEGLLYRSDVSGPTTTLTESLPSRSSNRSQRSPQPSSAAEIRRLFSSSHQATITALDILHSPISATTYLLSADANGLTKIWRL